MIRRSYLPDDGILDEVAIARRAAGDQDVRLTTRERHEVVRRLHAQGRHDAGIAEVTGLHVDQVRKDRKKLGLARNENPNLYLISPEHFYTRGIRRRAELRAAGVIV